MIFPPLLIVKLQVWGEAGLFATEQRAALHRERGRALKLTVNTNGLNMSQGCQKIGSHLKASSHEPP